MTDDLQRACDVLRQGGVILYPTDTVWGIGCDATCSDAVKRIYDIKQRADSKAMIVLVDSADMLRRWADVPDCADRLIVGSDRPLTLVLDNARGVAPELVAADGSIGMRVTGEEFSQSLCRELGVPLVSTSANFSGEAGATTFDTIDRRLLELVDYVCVTRRDDRRLCAPSRVVRLLPSGEVKILRP